MIFFVEFILIFYAYYLILLLFSCPLPIYQPYPCCNNGKIGTTAIIARVFSKGTISNFN